MDTFTEYEDEFNVNLNSINELIDLLPIQTKCESDDPSEKQEQSLENIKDYM